MSEEMKSRKYCTENNVEFEFIGSKEMHFVVKDLVVDGEMQDRTAKRIRTRNFESKKLFGDMTVLKPMRYV